MEQDIKKLLDEQKKEVVEEVTQKMGVFIEGVNENIKLIAEQHTSLQGHIVSMQENMVSIQEHVVSIDVRLTHIEDNLRRKVDYEEFEKLEKRVGMLEQKFVH